MKKIAYLATTLLFVFAVVISAQDITVNPNPVTERTGQEELLDLAAVTITHSASNTITSGNSVSCNSGGLHTDNSYFRAFTLSSFGITEDFNITMVEIGVETAAGNGGTQPITVNLWTSSQPFPTGFPGSVTLIGTANVNVADQTLSLLQIPVTGTAPAGSELVVEIFTPNGQTPGNSFFIGSNNLGETGPSYLLAADCGVTTPTATGAIGFPGMHIVMSVTGDVGAANDLFISEYLEGSSNNKAIEVFNPTGSAVDLSNYRMVRANNGSPTIQYVQPLYGTLAAGDVYVMVNPSADPILLAVADIDTGAITFYNGDDYMGLEKNINSVWTPIDVVGILGVDPGTAWPVAGVTNGTAEHTLVRKDVITMGNTDWNASAGTDSLNSEWLVYPQNTFQFLGNHSFIPVELTSFSASAINGTVVLNWSTATELNNQGFEIERKKTNSIWQKIGFVPGFGTTTEPREYSFTDNNLVSGTYSYRLKQVDFDGTFEYSSEIFVDVTPVNKFELSQNYPNPFNPSTKINFSIPNAGNVKLSVFNILGEEVLTLVDGFKDAGSYSITFDAKNLNTGVYIYRIEANNFTQTKKMTLIK